jgi:uncharacterized membrane protein
MPSDWLQQRAAFYDILTVVIDYRSYQMSHCVSIPMIFVSAIFARATLKAHTHRTRFGDFRGAARTEINQFIEIAIRCTHWTRYGKNSQGDFGKFALRANFFRFAKIFAEF